MPNYFKISLFIFSIFAIFILYQMYDKTATTMKYFPIDQYNSISEAETSLKYDENQKSTKWSVSSTSNQPVYLRQDVSLLYENGLFKGFLNKWENNSAVLRQVKHVPDTQNAVLQSISFHHGELQDDEDITSIQEMTHASLYVVIEENDSYAFSHPNTKREKEIAEKQMHQTNESLQTRLEDFLTYYNIDSNEYTIYPLVDLTKNEVNPKILGQFWEGLYSNYMTLLMSYKDKIPKHGMPFVLFAKDDSHLLVLFELEKEKYKLIQHLSPN